MSEETNRSDSVPKDHDSRTIPRLETQIALDEDDESQTRTSRSPSGSLRRRSHQSRRVSVTEEDISVPTTLEEKRQAINRLFGFKPSSHHVAHRPLEERSAEVRKLYEAPKKVKDVSKDSLINFPNLMWVILFGWWLCIVYSLVAAVLALTYFGLPYARWCWQLKSYFLWPFGKYIIRERPGKTRTEESALLKPINSEGHDSTSPASLIGKVLWYLIAVPLLIVLGHTWVLILCWELVVMIPMAKVNTEAIKLMFKSPLTLKVTQEYPGPSADVLLCTYRSSNIFYYKYSVQGMNIILVNMLPLVLASLVLGYVVPKEYRPSETVLFFMALASVVPLAYYIGQAVASISAQTSLAIGAVLNASFGSIVELILYFSAIKAGTLNALVQYTVTGSLLSTMLLLPGLSIFFGGLKHKEQRFNPVSTGVSSVLLMISVIGVFTPTIYYHSWGTYTLMCANCSPPNTNGTGLVCSGCIYEQIKYDQDPYYREGARPLMYACSVILPIAYIVGLIFTLKTHADIFEASNESGGDHEAPEWSKWKGICILVGATLLFSAISELLIDSIVPSIDALGLNEAFVGVFFLGTVANAAEIINAISFALRDNVALSIEIGAAATVQAALIQIPALVIFSAILNHASSVGSFTLIFPTLNVFAIIFGVITVNYIYINGRTNYFEGTAILLIWATFVIAFYFVPFVEQ